MWDCQLDSLVPYRLKVYMRCPQGLNNPFVDYTGRWVIHEAFLKEERRPGHPEQGIWCTSWNRGQTEETNHAHV